MSFTIDLMRNNSPENYLYKDLETIQSVECTLRNETSIIDPVLVLTGIDTSISDNVNYAHIPSFNRYYFVKNIVSIRDGVWAIYCHVDVLYSWKAELLANGKGIIKRQEYKYNLYLDDGIFKCYQDPLIQVKVFPSGFTTQEFVLAVAGSDATASDGGSGNNEPGENVSV